MRHLVCLLALVLLAACGDDGPRGRDGSRCRVEVEGAGAAVMRCDDGTELPVTAATCTVSPNDDGSATLRCGDSEAIVGGGAVVADGSIVGAARMEDAAPGPGIEVSLVDLDRSASTDEAGRFAFDDLPLGIYRLRFSAPGHAPLDLPNVAVMGDATDLGVVALSRGRALAVGPRAPIVSESGRWAAFFQPGPVGILGDLLLVDLETWEARIVEREISFAAFEGDRLIAVTESVGGVAIAVHDLPTGERRAYQPMYVERLLSGGFAGYRGTTLHLVTLTGEVIELPSAAAGVHADGDRWAVVQADDRVGAFDSETGELRWVPDGGVPIEWSGKTGRIVVRRGEGAGTTLHVFDAAAGDEVSLGGSAPGSLRAAFSADGSLLAWTDDGGVHLYDFAAGTRTDAAVATGDPFPSPSGRFVALTSGWRVDAASGEAHALAADAWDLIYSQDERLAFTEVAGQAAILDETGTAVWSATEAAALVAIVGETFLVDTAGEFLVIDAADTPPAVETVGRSDGTWVWSAASATLALRDPEGLRALRLAPRAEFLLEGPILFGDPLFPRAISEDGRFVLASHLGGFQLLEVESGAAHRIDAGAVDVVLADGGYFYRVLDPESRHPAAGEEDDPTTIWHWAVYP